MPSPETDDLLRSKPDFHEDQIEQLAFELAFELEEAELSRNDLVTVNRDRLRAIASRALSRPTSPATAVTGVLGGELEPIGRITEGGSIEWFKPPIRKGTVLYAAPGSTLTPNEVECVCKRVVCSYDADFGCGLDRSKERHDV